MEVRRRYMYSQEKGENQHVRDKMLRSKWRVWILKQYWGTIIYLFKYHKSIIIAKKPMVVGGLWGRHNCKEVPAL